jgi:hypothetical protein
MQLQKTIIMCSQYNNEIYVDPKEQKELAFANDIRNLICKFGLNWNVEHALQS